MWNLKYDTNEPKKQTQTHKYREQTCAWRRRGVGEEGLGVWDYWMQTSVYRKYKQHGLTV